MPLATKGVPTCQITFFFSFTGLGQHGLVGTSDESLLSLHDALKAQFEAVQKTYSEALTKLESLKGHQHKSQNQSKAPIAQSHQRQLSLKASEIQERLIKNKTLLNVVEPTLENHSLEVLLGKFWNNCIYLLWVSGKYYRFEWLISQSQSILKTNPNWSQIFS